MKKIVTFGELMLRLAPKGYLRFLQEPEFQAAFGGGEANVAVSLANYGAEAVFVTKLPKNDIAEAAVRELRRYHVDTAKITRGGQRMGIYYLEKGASQRPSKVIYDRAHSAISAALPSDFDWDDIFGEAGWFHFTGITPALGGNLPQICLEAVKAAKSRGLTVSCDLNYRKSLWTCEEAERVMVPLMEYVDVCIANEEDAEKVFSIKANATDVKKGSLNRDGYAQVAARLRERFGFHYVAITLRTSLSASDNQWAAALYNGMECFFSKEYPIHIVDRVGGGDSFAGGLIYGLIAGMEDKEALEFAVAASCLKHSVEGDFNLATAEEVCSLAAGDGSGRVQR